MTSKNISNTQYINMSDDEIKAYKKDNKLFYTFSIKFDEIYLDSIKEHFKDITIKKNTIKDDNDNVNKDDFDIMDFNNDQCKQYTLYNIFVVCHRDNKQKIYEITTSISNNNFVRNFDHRSSIELDQKKSEYGHWETINQKDIKYPICILTYKRANQYGKTHLTLCRSKIKHYLFVEPCEFDDYDKWVNKEYAIIIKCPRNFHEDNMGSSVVRNYILQWAFDHEYKRVWMLDDNISRYKRFYQGVKREILGNSIYTTIEDYVERYDNVGIASHNFNPFIMENKKTNCLCHNTKCYSSMLIPTFHDIRFRYKHQEDNLISFEYINKGYATLSFNHILYDKDTSGLNKGGNHETIYKVKKGTDGDGYRERYEYFKAICFVLQCEKKLKLIEGKTLDDLVSRSTTMKSKEYHAKVNYKVLQGKDNKIIKKDEYNEIKFIQETAQLKWIKREKQ